MKIKMYWSFAHFGRMNSHLWPLHGPQVWPWWKMMAAEMVSLTNVVPPTVAKRVWFYSRWGAIYVDIYFRGDRVDLTNAYYPYTINIPVRKLYSKQKIEE